MVTTAHDLRGAGVNVPILVGGAALTERFTFRRIAAQYDGPVAYAKDAMTGLDLANRLMDKEQRIELEKLIEKKKRDFSESETKKAPTKKSTPSIATHQSFLMN